MNGDPVPTRAERLAAVVALLAMLAAMACFAMGHPLPGILAFFVALTGGTIAKFRVTPESLFIFGLREVPENDPTAAAYRARIRDNDRATRERVKRLDERISDHPWLERGIIVTLLVVGLGALAAIPLVRDGGGDGLQRVGRLLLVGLIALNGALIMYAASHIASNEETKTE